MGLEKGIQHGKENRRPYRGSRSIDGTCRNHGSCSWCAGNRLHQRRKLETAARQERADTVPLSSAGRSDC
jgi:hypothetical protein